jgi:hypothetical protein
MGAALMGSHLGSIKRLFAVACAYTALLAAVTHPQLIEMGRAIPRDVDPYFSIWRLAWIAHQLLRNPSHLFDANIFFPERHTLAYSDAMIAPGIIGAPLFWLHVNPVLIYNLWLFAGFVLSAVAMFVLVESLTGSVPGALAAGALFMCAPSRFDHYVHLELQLTFCMPIALWALHRLLQTHEWKMAIVVGATVALQMFCSIYYGVFLATFVAIVAGIQLVLPPYERLGRRIVLLATAGILAAAIVTPYVLPYLGARQRVGSRESAEVRYYSAVPADYLSARTNNWLYGDVFPEHQGGEERHLFPGFLILVAAALSLWSSKPRLVLLYLAAGLFAFDASLGLNGHVFASLRAWLLPYQGLRVPARFNVLLVLSLSVLAGIGISVVANRLSRLGRVLLVAAIFVASGLEARSSLTLIEPPLRASSVDTWLAARPRSPLLELPLPPVEAPFQISEAEHIYDSIFHWQPLLNGISGFWPKSYFALLDNTRHFPDDDSIAYVKGRGVRYLVARESHFTPEAYAAMRDALAARPDLALAVEFTEPGQEAVVFELR